ncbi:MAG: hypothetical protein H0V33_08645 [Acidimicrobiia bacterium]|nr:hypothetical protein [Acidimicrobiia bacterium]
MERTPESLRFQAALHLAETGVRLMRQNFRRRHPGASDSDIDALLRSWLRDRPMDAPGRVVPNPSR